MESVCLVLDIHGLEINSQFYFKEVAFASIKHNYRSPVCFRFQLPDHSVHRCEESLKRFVDETVVEPLNQSDFDRILLTRWMLEMTPDRTLVAFRGNHHVKEILDLLRIPNVDLQSLGCPSYRELYPVYIRRPKHIPFVTACGLHETLHEHCVKVRAHAARLWIIYREEEAAA